VRRSHLFGLTRHFRKPAAFGVLAGRDRLPSPRTRTSLRSPPETSRNFPLGQISQRTQKVALKSSYLRFKPNIACLKSIILVRSQKFIGGVIRSCRGEHTLRDRRSHSQRLNLLSVSRIPRKLNENI
jgi:hypothetical protein